MKELNWLEFKQFVDDRSIETHYIEFDSRYYIHAFDGPLSFFCDLSKDDALDFEDNYKALSNTKIGNYYNREPFLSKVLKDGSKLFRRKHGMKDSIIANSEKEIVFTVPYAHAKINKLEIIDANALDRIDLYVKSPVDPAVAALYGFPSDYLLNQFAFDVIVSDLLYSDKSDYDADVYQGFQIVAKYKNDTAEDKTVGFNLIYHEVVS